MLDRPARPPPRKGWCSAWPGLRVPGGPLVRSPCAARPCLRPCRPQPVLPSRWASPSPPCSPRRRLVRHRQDRRSCRVDGAVPRGRLPRRHRRRRRSRPPASRPASTTCSSPPPTREVEDGDRVALRRGRQIELVVDGQAPHRLGHRRLRRRGARPARPARPGAGAVGLPLARASRSTASASTSARPRTSSIVGRRRRAAASPPPPRPSRDALAEAGVALDADDRLSVPPEHAARRRPGHRASPASRTERSDRERRRAVRHRAPRGRRADQGHDQDAAGRQAPASSRRTVETRDRRRQGRERTVLSQRRTRHRAGHPRPRRRHQAAPGAGPAGRVRRRRHRRRRRPQLGRRSPAASPAATRAPSARTGKYRGLYQFSTPPGAASAAPATRPRPRAGEQTYRAKLLYNALRRRPVAALRQVPVRRPVDRPAWPTEGLLTAPDVRALADALGLRPTKTLGQNFVIDPNTVRRLVRTAGVGVDDVVVEVGPGLGSLTLGLLEVAARVVAVEIDPVLAGRAARDGRRAAARSAPTGSRSSLQDALTLDRRARPAADGVRREPALQRRRAGAAAAARAPAVAAHRPGDGAGRGRRPAGRAARQPDVRRPVGQGRLVRRGAPRRGRSAGTSSGRRRNVDSGLVAFTRREPPPGDRLADLRRRRRGVRPAAQDAARRAGRLGRLGRPPPRSGCAPPASTRARAARCSASRTSPGWPPRPPG